MSEELISKGPHVPTEERALERLSRAVERGELEELPAIPGIPNTPPLPGHVHELADGKQRDAFVHGCIRGRTRRTICFSKTERMHDLVIGLFINRYEFGVSL